MTTQQDERAELIRKLRTAAKTVPCFDMHLFEEAADMLEADAHPQPQAVAVTGPLALLIGSVDALGREVDVSWTQTAKENLRRIQMATKWLSTSPAAPAAAQVAQPLTEEGACRSCGGSGTQQYTTYGHGPDDYEYEADCETCRGTGSSDIRDAIKSIPYQPHTVKTGLQMIDRAEVLRLIDAHGIGKDQAS